MLHAFPGNSGDPEKLDGVRWIDLIDPTDNELAAIRDRYGIDLPTRPMLEKIEASSRLKAKGDTLTMSAPLISGITTDHWQVAPVGFVLTPDLLVTVRFAPLESLEAVSKDLSSARNLTAPEALTRLLEAVVDRAADHLERGSEKINEMSQAIFFDEHKHQRLSRDTKVQRHVMRTLGQVSDRIARVRYAFLNIGRIADFALERCTPKLDDGIRDRLEAVRRDIASLDEFEESLSSRVQLLQDSAVGFISMEQNDVVKVLTVASVVGVPPVLIVGIYGMNFKNMPELSWRLGYPYALALCVLSMVIPLIWFKWRDWI